MIKSNYKGNFTIGDNLYLEQQERDPKFKNLIFSSDFDSNVEVSVADIVEDDYSIAVALIHFYNGEKQMGFNLVDSVLLSVEGLQTNDMRLGCDTASFQIIGKNNTTVRTLSDGHFGDVIQSDEGETIITFYVTHDSMKANELLEKIALALGLEQ